MRQHEVECPTGLVIVAREYQVTDEDLSANRRSIRRGTTNVDLLAAITLKVVDPGHYTPLAGGGVNWAKVVQGDIMTVLLKNRIFTWGESYTMSPSCPECRRPAPNDVDLSELEPKPLPESSVEHVRDGTPLECTLPGAQKKVQFRLLRGEDERLIRRIKKDNKDSMSSSYLRARTLGIEGVEPRAWKEWLGKLGGNDASYLRAQFDEQDCGIDTEFEFECGECDHVWFEEVRFTKDFLFPKYRKKEATKRS